MNDLRLARDRDDVPSHGLDVRILRAYEGRWINDGGDQYVVTHGYEDLLTSDDEVRCENN